MCSSRSGGHNLWLTFRRRLNEARSLRRALRCGVSVMPGAAVDRRAVRSSGSLRLSFSLADDELLDEGVRRLAKAFRATLRTDQYASTAAVA